MSEENNSNIEEGEPINKKIKNIVISGGGHNGFYTYGLLHESNLQNFWNIDDIQGMYGTSVGSLICVLLCLKYDWDVMDNYLINRPWQNVFVFDIYSLVNVFHTKGIFNIDTFKEVFRPLFYGADQPISIDITMKEFYELTKIDLHIYTTELNTFECIDISHKTHPDFSLVEAVYCSCSIPILFTPIIKENECNIDGCFMSHYPIEYCINNTNDRDEIMGICKMMNFEKKDEPLNSEKTFFDYLIAILNKIIKLIINSTNQLKHNKIKNQFIIFTESISIYDIIEILTSSEKRENMINEGRELFTKKMMEI